MNYSPAPFAMGFVIGAVSLAGIVLNAIVILAIFHGKLLKGPYSSVFVFALQSMAPDIVMLLLHLVYLAPSVWLQDYLFDGGMHDVRTDTLSNIFMYCWYISSISHIVIALTRLQAVVFYWNCTRNRRQAIIISSMVHVISLLLAIFSQSLSPCCKMTFNYVYYSYFYDESSGATNLSNDIVDLPLNSLSSLTAFTCYMVIVIFMRKARLKSGKLDRKMKNMQMEYRYAMQFCAMAAWYSFSWPAFRLLPPLADYFEQKWIAGITAIFIVLNASSNAVVYLFNNQEIKKSILSMISRKNEIAVVTPVSPRS